MTREEAIWYLQPIADSASLPRYAEALNMAISALKEQEERSKICDGCIYKGKRHQRCSCCRRNPDMKDGYKEGA